MTKSQVLIKQKNGGDSSLCTRVGDRPLENERSVPFKVYYISRGDSSLCTRVGDRPLENERSVPFKVYYISRGDSSLIFKGVSSLGTQGDRPLIPYFLAFSEFVNLQPGISISIFTWCAAVFFFELPHKMIFGFVSTF